MHIICTVYAFGDFVSLDQSWNDRHTDNVGCGFNSAVSVRFAQTDFSISRIEICFLDPHTIVAITLCTTPASKCYTPGQ